MGNELGEFLWNESARVDHIFCLNWVSRDTLPSALEEFLDYISHKDLKKVFGKSIFQNVDEPWEESSSDETFEALLDFGYKGWLAEIYVDIRTRISEDSYSTGGSSYVEWVYSDRIEDLPTVIKAKVNEVIARMNKESAKHERIR